jgi:non-lysosomal glucosylceramidase
MNQPSTTTTKITRRELLRFGSLAAVGSLTLRFQSAMAGPFTGADFDKLVPADKKLSAAWLRALTERGEVEWLGGQDLQHIGMPVGGICCGQVYLSGDGRLWHWDIFNQGVATDTGGSHYAKPMPVASAVDLGFQIRVNGEARPLDRTGFPQVRFRGAYPIGFVDFRDDAFPVKVSLEAFSPFAPLDVDGSSLPLTVMRYTLRNPTTSPVEVSLAGALANPVLIHSGVRPEIELVNRIVKRQSATCLHCAAEKAAVTEVANPRPEIVFDDFEAGNYDNWTVEGTAFGSGPVEAAKMPSYQGNVGGHGGRLVNSHHTRNGENPAAADAHAGTLTSKPFKIERRFIHVLVGGGVAASGGMIELLVGDKVVATASGQNQNVLTRRTFSVAEHEGREARLRIVDKGTQGWGNIGVDYIVFSDVSAAPAGSIDSQPDMGEMTLAILGDASGVFHSPGSADFSPPGWTGDEETTRKSSTSRPKGTVGRNLTLAPGEEAVVSFAVAWRFPNHAAPVDKGHYYAKRFSSSLAVVDHHAADHEASVARTRLWHETWYDSTLPHWLLDRSFLNLSTLATTTSLRMENGRFWGWEGVGCCQGTCTHVWHYAQAVGRVFPELERITREHVDYGLAYQPDGLIFYRAEFGKHEAIDGHCGTILRVLREHTMSPDDAFLRRIWPRVKGSIEYLIRQDGDANGVLEGAQMNTLDAAWFGPISWISSLYLAALRAGAVMAREMGDEGFAATCDALIGSGSKWLAENLFDGEFFYQKRDPKHPDAFGAGIGCHIDQVMGQGWAHQLALGRVLPEDKTRTALQSLWRYNFSPDVAAYRKQYTAGRWYAMPGEAGLIMCTFPKGGEREARGGKPEHGFAGYFNECMNGFEYQAAGHMVAEGMVREGLAVTRAVHDRYHASRRNPYNEIECGDHYARSMASYGVFVSLCGFECHGPKKHLGFAPKITPENFKAPFIAAAGWGTYSQRIDNGKLTAEFCVRHGKLALATLALEHEGGDKVSVKQGATTVPATLKRTAKRILVTIDSPLEIAAGEMLAVSVS